MPVPLVELTAVQVLALACLGIGAGVWLKRNIPILDRLNIPAPVIGGLLYAGVVLLLRDRFANFEMDLTLRDILMVAFFTTVGMSASLRLVREGGRQVVVFFVFASVAAALQNALGYAAARGMGLDPLIGIICGSVALAGGPATALAFGGTFEQLGVQGATALGVAAATFGIVAGGLLGGPIGGQLIRRHKLVPASRGLGSLSPTEAIVYAGDPLPAPATPLDPPSQSEHAALLKTVAAISVAMGAGTLISAAFAKTGLLLPSYVGAMIAAAAIRNLDDRYRVAGISQHLVDAAGTTSLYIFIVMTLMTVRLWELVHLAAPMMAILALQLALVWIMSVTLAFRSMGRDYDAAVMAGGFTGFMMGTTANALACMEALATKYGPAPRAFIVVPLVGAFLIDFTNALIITVATNLLR